MGKVKEIRIIEEAVFEVIHSLHQSMYCRNLENYRLGLAVLEQLNSEYCDLTGQYYMPPMRELEYHSNQWSKFQ
jgi:hypothetical protein